MEIALSLYSALESNSLFLNDDFLFERKYMDKVGFETISHYLYETRYNNKFFNDLHG